MSKKNWIQTAYKSRFILVHGWDGSPTKNWFPWLADKIATEGNVLNLAMPQPHRPDKTIWVKHLEDHILPSKNDVFIAHSIGCMAVLWYLTKISTKIRAAILVAPFSENERDYKTISSFFSQQLDWKIIKKNCHQLYTLHSDDDPYVSTWQRFIFKEELNATSFVEKDMGHFDDKKLPKIMKIVQNL